MRPLSAIIFDVKATSEYHTETDIMRRVFSHSEGVHLRTRSPLLYQSGSYEMTLDTPEVWTGRLERIRTDPVSTVQRDENGSFYFVDELAAVPTSQATTYFAYAANEHLLVYIDTAEMPYTRLQSYVSGAIQRAGREGFDARCEVQPRRIERPIREWVRHFTTIERVRVQFRHSQSPGNRAIDSILEQLNAQTAIEIVEAAPKKALNKEALFNAQLPIGQALDHLEQASNNGEASISGHVGTQFVKFRSRDPVERHMLTVEDTAPEFRSSLSKLAARLLAIGDKQ